MTPSPASSSVPSSVPSSASPPVSSLVQSSVPSVADASAEPFRCSALIKEIGRGAQGARALSREQADALYAAMLDGRVSDIELGAILLAYRIKGETPAELAGMLSAAHRHLSPIDAPSGPFRPVSIPSYNGARKQPNLTPLLALLLARRRVPVVVHGVRDDPGRVTSAAILAALGHPAATSAADAGAALRAGRPSFVPIDVLSSPLARLLGLRATLGVRNSTHTLVKLLDPFSEAGAGDWLPHPGLDDRGERPARPRVVRLVNYTHPPYRDSLAALFRDFPDIARGDVLLARGTEGEAVADTRRQVQIDWLRDGQAAVLIEAARRDPAAAAPALPASLDAAETAAWISDVLADKRPVPDAIARQVDEITRIAATVVDTTTPRP